MGTKEMHAHLEPRLEEKNQHVPVPQPTNGLLIRDIKERDPHSTLSPPVPPTFRNQTSGFPSHKDRVKRLQDPQKQENKASNTKTGYPPAGAPIAKQPTRSQNGVSTNITKGRSDPSIDKENKERLAQMSEEEIRIAKQGLMSDLSPSLIEKLLKKANIEEDETPLNAQGDPLMTPQAQRLPPSSSIASPKEVAFNQEIPSSVASATTLSPHYSPDFDPDAPPIKPPTDLFAASTPSSSLPALNPTKFHFPPTPGPPPTLDPSSPTFQESLKEHYFPTLPHDPSSLSWMHPPTSSEKSAYSSSANALPPSALRFDFRGRLLPPRLAAQLPTTKGLHHHGHAPESAGYTIPEMAHLARSTVPSQRCVAFQTLGRVLYRLGRGDFGQEGEDLCEGLWECMDKGRVLEGLVEAAATTAAEGGRDGNRSVWVTATEACWLWRKGGGRRWKGR